VDTVHLVRARTPVLPRSWTKLPLVEHEEDAAPEDDSDDPADCNGSFVGDGVPGAVVVKDEGCEYEGVEEHTLAQAFDRATVAGGGGDGAMAAGLLWRGVAC